MEQQNIIGIDPRSLVPEAMKLKTEGYRLVQICATKAGEEYELTYYFGKEYEFLCLRYNVPDGGEITSISNIFAPAFLYENEIHDLFGIKVNLLTLDYEGNLYHLEHKTPFH